MMSARALPAPCIDDELRVVALPPTRADGDALAKLFVDNHLKLTLVSTMAQLCARIQHGAGCAILSEEALLNDADVLASELSRQPMWSDFPIIVLSRAGSESIPLVNAVSRLGNVTVAERPMRPSSLIFLVRSNQRARARQYQVREHLIRQQQADEERESLLASERAARGDAERAGRMKDEFLATLSHELRTPLTAILGWTQILRKATDLPEDAAQGLSTIERNAHAQAKIIADLLNMSSIISGKVKLDVQPVDLALVINATIETLRPAAQAKNIAIQLNLDPHRGLIMGDPGRLQQVMWNLLANAVKFTSKGGHVAIRLSTLASQIEIEVRDTGEGIDGAFLPYIFDRFRQAEGSSMRRHGGLGLGLAIVKQLVELHGGSIAASSEGQGRGACFLIKLPLIPATSQPPANTECPPEVVMSDIDGLQADTVSLQGLTVLVVDDEADGRALVDRLLTDRGACVFTAGSVAEALDILSRYHVDLLISDIGMPLEDGYILIRRLRDLKPPLSTIPAIALTAYAQPADRARAIQAGYQAHLIKPVEPGELLATIARALKNAESLQQ